MVLSLKRAPPAVLHRVDSASKRGYCIPSHGFPYRGCLWRSCGPSAKTQHASCGRLQKHTTYWLSPLPRRAQHCHAVQPSHDKFFFTRLTDFCWWGVSPFLSCGVLVSRNLPRITIGRRFHGDLQQRPRVGVRGPCPHEPGGGW